MSVVEIARLAEELQAREKTVPAGFKWPRMEAVDPVRALSVLRDSRLRNFVPPAGENLGLPPNEYYGDAQYLMPEEPRAAAVIADARPAFSDGSRLWHLGVILRTDWGHFKVATEIGCSTDGVIRPNPYVYDRVYVRAYAETGYEDGTPRTNGKYDASLAQELYQIVQTLLGETAA